MAISNPSSEILMSIKMACDVLMAKDKNSAKYIESLWQKNEKEKLKKKTGRGKIQFKHIGQNI